MTLSTTRLELLLKVAEKTEAEALATALEAEKRQADLAAILSELERYLAEYEARPLGVISPLLLENRRQFNLRLQSAIEQQRKGVGEAAARAAKARDRWQAMRKDVKVTETLLEQARVEERRLADRHSQREMDEFALLRRHSQASLQ